VVRAVWRTIFLSNHGEGYEEKKSERGYIYLGGSASCILASSLARADVGFYEEPARVGFSW